MATVTCYLRASVDEVFDVISDPRTYPQWLVGAREIRSIDDGWPAVGTKFHHRVGLVGPVTVADNSEVVAIGAPGTLVLEVRARPLGRGRVTFTLTEEPTLDGRPLTHLTMDEVPIGAMAPLRPVLDPPTVGRNRTSLNALVAYLNTPPAARDRDSA